MEKPTVLSESGILFVSKVYCLHASNATTHNDNWSWVINASITSRKGEPPKVGRLVRLIKILALRKDEFSIASTCFCDLGMLKSLHLQISDWNTNFSTVSTPDCLCKEVAKSISDALEKVKGLTTALSWEKVLSRKGVSFSGLIRAAVAISGQYTLERLSAIPVDSVIDSAITVLKTEEYGWFKRLYGPLNNLFCAVMFSPQISKNNEGEIESFTFNLPVLFNNESVVAVFGRMENAVSFINTLNRDRDDKVKGESSAVEYRLYNKKSFRLNIMMPELKLYSKALNVIEMVRLHCKRHCPAGQKMFFKCSVNGGVPLRICRSIENIMVPLVKYLMVFTALTGVLNNTKLFNLVVKVFRNPKVVVYLPGQITTGVIVNVVGCFAATLFVLYVVKVVRKYLQTSEKIRTGNIKPGIWEYFLLPFEKKKNIEWIA